MIEETTVRKVPMARRHGVKRVVAGLLLAVTGAVAVTTAAQADARGGHEGGGFGHHGGAMMGSGGPMMGRMLDRMLGSVNATEAQRTQIKQIADAAAADLRTQREAGRALREQGLKLFAAPVVDANAVEALRQQMLAQHDQRSKRMSQAMVDISRVLTPEQRAQLGEQMRQRAEKMRDRHQHRGAGQPGK